jgi:hypothetical protein
MYQDQFFSLLINHYMLKLAKDEGCSHETWSHNKCTRPCELSRIEPLATGPPSAHYSGPDKEIDEKGTKA